MKRLGIILILVLILSAAAVGCGKSKQTSSTSDELQQNDQQAAERNGRQFMQGPEGNLGREIMSIMRIQNSETPFTKEQSTKLIALLTDIKAKESVDEEYSNKKIEEINAVMTQQQKDILAQRMGNPNRNQEAGSTDGNAQPPGTRFRDGQNNGENNGRTNGQNNRGNNGGSDRNGSGFDLKSICDRTITALQEADKVSQ